jgi:hypothetical protein
MTPAEPPEDTRPPEISEAWGDLWKWVTSQRRRWDEFEVKAAMRSAAARGAAYKEVSDTLYRLGWDTEARTHQVLGELSNLCRFGPGGDPEAWKRGGQLARELLANRNTAGSLPALTGNDEGRDGQ